VPFPASPAHANVVSQSAPSQPGALAALAMAALNNDCSCGSGVAATEQLRRPGGGNRFQLPDEHRHPLLDSLVRGRASKAHQQQQPLCPTSHRDGPPPCARQRTGSLRSCAVAKRNNRGFLGLSNSATAHQTAVSRQDRKPNDAIRPDQQNHDPAHSCHKQPALRNSHHINLAVGYSVCFYLASVTRWPRSRSPSRVSARSYAS